MFMSSVVGFGYTINLSVYIRCGDSILDDGGGISMMLLPVKADMMTLSIKITSSSEVASQTNLNEAFVGNVYSVFKMLTTLFEKVLLAK